MTTLNGLPAHILLVHAVVVLLPLASLLLILCAVWPAARRRLAGPSALLSLIVVALVPVTTDAGTWLESHVASTPLIRTHTALGDTAIFVAIPVAVLALVVWWRGREAAALSQLAARPADPDVAGDDATSSVAVITEKPAAHRRTILAPASAALSVIIAVLSIAAAGAAMYDVYQIGDSGAQATWQGQVNSAP